jgi:hypothetical protein
MVRVDCLLSVGSSCGSGIDAESDFKTVVTCGRQRTADDRRRRDASGAFQDAARPHACAVDIRRIDIVGLFVRVCFTDYRCRRDCDRAIGRQRASSSFLGTTKQRQRALRILSSGGRSARTR